MKRLRVSHIDLYQCHRYDAETPLEETMQALSEVVEAGKVRYIGFSEWPVDRVEAALAIPGVERFVSSQPQYSLLHRDPERALIPLCARSGISQIVWSPLAQGVLTGKYCRADHGAPPDSRAADDAISGFLNQEWLEPKVLAGGSGVAAARRPSRPDTCLSSRWPGYCGSRTWLRRSSGPPGLNRSMRMPGLRTTVASELFESAERIIGDAMLSE